MGGFASQTPLPVSLRPPVPPELRILLESNKHQNCGCRVGGLRIAQVDPARQGSMDEPRQQICVSADPVRGHQACEMCCCPLLLSSPWVPSLPRVTPPPPPLPLPPQCAAGPPHAPRRDLRKKMCPRTLKSAPLCAFCANKL